MKNLLTSDIITEEQWEFLRKFSYKDLDSLSNTQFADYFSRGDFGRAELYAWRWYYLERTAVRSTMLATG